MVGPSHLASIRTAAIGYAVDGRQFITITAGDAIFTIRTASDDRTGAGARTGPLTSGVSESAGRSPRIRCYAAGTQTPRASLVVCGVTFQPWSPDGRCILFAEYTQATTKAGVHRPLTDPRL